MNNEEIKAQIEADTIRGIARGWDAASSEWRKMALMTLCDVALRQKTLSVNDFRDAVKGSEIKTHNYAALGGLMVTARGFGWIRVVGNEPSPASHHGDVRLWESLIYQEKSFTDRQAEYAQRQRLFS